MNGKKGDRLPEKSKHNHKGNDRRDDTVHEDRITATQVGIFFPKCFPKKKQIPHDCTVQDVIIGNRHVHAVLVLLKTHVVVIPKKEKV